MATVKTFYTSEEVVRMFIGWLSADIRELHSVEVPRLAASWERFKQKRWSDMAQDQMGNECLQGPTFDGKAIDAERLNKAAAERVVGFAGANASPPPIMMQITSNATEVLRCLFFHGPTWDGNVPSKSGRDELVDMKLAARANGWQWLTRAGMEVCFANGIDKEKDMRESRDRSRRNRAADLARAVLE